MSSADEKLQDIANSLKKKKDTPKGSTRELLAMYDQKRRGSYVVAKIRKGLTSAGLKTVPDFENAFVDEAIDYVLLEGNKDHDVGKPTMANGPRDVMVRLGIFKSANRKPVSVRPDDQLTDAISIMISEDFSQLPVMTTEREVKGMITWETIGRASGLGLNEPLVSAYMKEAHILPKETPLIDAIPEIIRKEYVLVKDKSNKICGIVTDNDLSRQFNDLTAPFLLLNEIETQLREFLSNRCLLSDADIRKHSKKAAELNDEFITVNDLAFSEYNSLFADDDLWSRAKIRISNKVFREKLEKVRRHRNDVMHFNVDEPDQDMLDDLRTFAKLLEILRTAPKV